MGIATNEEGLTIDQRNSIFTQVRDALIAAVSAKSNIPKENLVVRFLELPELFTLLTVAAGMSNAGVFTPAAAFAYADFLAAAAGAYLEVPDDKGIAFLWLLESPPPGVDVPVLLNVKFLGSSGVALDLCSVNNALLDRQFNDPTNGFTSKVNFSRVMMFVDGDKFKIQANGDNVASKFRLGVLLCEKKGESFSCP